MQSPALTSRRELDRRIISLAIPALGTLAIEPIYVLVDTAIVGRLGTPQLGGLAIASTILLTVISLTASLEYGITPDVAFAHGAGRAMRPEPRPRRPLRLGVDDRRSRWGQSSPSWPNPLAWLLGGRGDVLGVRRHVPADQLHRSALRVDHVCRPRRHAWGQRICASRLQIVVIANVVNVVLEIVAVYWLDLGVAGSAWSTVIVQAGAAIDLPAGAASSSRRWTARSPS